MLKKSLIAIAVLAIAMPALAGSIKIHDPWPTTLVKQEVATIDVQLDVGYYIHIDDQDPITVVQDTAAADPYKTYIGEKTTDVTSNFAAVLECEAAAVSAAGGNWTCTLSDTLIPAATTNIKIDVSGTDVDIAQLVGGSKGVKVAEITIKVLPQ
jgi:hypothetical protein